MPLFFDTETRSDVPIAHGTDRYVRSCECIMATWAFDDEPVDIAPYLPAWGQIALPDRMLDYLRDGGPNDIIIAHGAKFDFGVLTYALGIETDIRRWRCTQSQAYAHGLPGSLQLLGSVLGLPPEDAKLAGEGSRLIHTFCVPGPGTSLGPRDVLYLGPEDRPDDWRDFCTYGVRDVHSLRIIYRKLPTHNYRGTDLEWYFLDQLVNWRGFRFDKRLATAARSLLEKAKGRGGDDINEATNGEVRAATQRAKLLEYLNRVHGADLANLRAATVREMLEADDLAPGLRFLLESRLEAAKSSGAKYGRGLTLVGPQDRLRHCHQVFGAGRTGRDSHKGFQPGNMARQTMKAEYIDEIVIPAILDGSALDSPLLVGGPNTACANALRGGIIAAPGNELIDADFSNIESRVLAWLASAQGALKGYRAGTDLYKAWYSEKFGIPIEEVTYEQRQIAKVVCFAAETQVLTDSGWKAIVGVSVTDKLWDGVEWVSHAGTVAKGVQQIVNVAGIEVTASHLIYDGTYWRRADELASSERTLRRALRHGTESLPSSIRSTTHLFGCAAVAEQSRTACISSIYGPAPVRGATPALKRLAGLLAGVLARLSCAVRRTVTDLLHGCMPHDGAALTRKTLSGTATAGEVYVCAPSGAPTSRASCATFKPYLAGMIRRLKWTAQTTNAATSRGISDLSVAPITAPIGERLEVCNRTSRSWKPVYDIVNAGPRQRFTVRATSGEALIAHNCLSMGFLGGVGAYVPMAATYQMDLDELPGIVLPHASEAQLAKADKAWARAALAGDEGDFELERDVYMACDVLKQAYREGNSEIFKTGHELGAAVIEAIKNPGTAYEVARCHIWRSNTALLIQLPDGGRLTYFAPMIHIERERDPITGKESVYESTSYMTARGMQWRREKAWAGLYWNNVTQAIANRLLRLAALRIHADTLTVPAIAAYLAHLPAHARTAIVLRVHDSLTLDVPKGSYPLARIIAQMNVLPTWAAGLPIATSGWVNERFGKRD